MWSHFGNDFDHPKAQQSVTGKRIERIPNNFGAGCYQVSTTRGITTVTVLNKTYQCSRSGQQIDINVIFNGLKYEGSLLCS
eukprot:Em0022g804a